MAQTTFTHPHLGRLRTRHQGKNWENWAALIGGAALTVFGVTRKSLPGAAIAGAGGFLTYRGATSDRALTGLVPFTGAQPISVHLAVTVNKPAGELFAFWRQLDNLPRFMRHLDSVRPYSPRGSHWTARAPLGSNVEWDAEITDERENELIAWRSTEESAIQNWGRVEFRPAPQNRGTEVHVRLEYLPPGGSVGRWFAKALGEEPEMQIREDLRRFKALLETGEIPTTEGQPSGRRSAVTRAATRFYTEAERDRELQRAV